MTSETLPSPEPVLPASRTGNAQALLHEMVRMLERFLASGETGGIDLRTLPLTKLDLDQLLAVLGKGAVEARIDALGESRVVETRFPGIWWVTHCNGSGETVAEAIEICAAPAILLAPDEDIADGAARLVETLAQLDRES